MSINDFYNKIKDKFNIDTYTIMCLLIIIGVGISSFGLGRLATLNSSIERVEDVKIIDTNNQLGQAAGINSNKILDAKVVVDGQKVKRYVASKNGKLYYTLDCSGAKKISEKNMIWFETKEQAEKSGFQFSSSCK